MPAKCKTDAEINGKKNDTLLAVSMRSTRGAWNLEAALPLTVSFKRTLASSQCALSDKVEATVNFCTCICDKGSSMYKSTRENDCG